MLLRWLADLIVLVHLAFVLFVAAGGVAVYRWPRLAWVHAPAVAWGVIVEWAGWICPLTPLEQAMRRRAGEAGYSGGFIEHYVSGVLYPEGLTRASQVVFGVLALGVNIVIYGLLAASRRGTHHGAGGTEP